MTIPDPPRKVLTLDAVRRSIATLQKPFIHEQFIAYLHIRKRGIEDGSMTVIEPRWGDVSTLLAVAGGPPNKPHYRPVSSRTKHDPSGYWLNPNIAGSYAPKSLRSASRFMLDSAGNFSLPNDHAQQSLEAHLRGKRQPAWPFAGFFLRDYSFDAAAGTVEDLIDGFRQVFRFDVPGPGSDFDVLFTTGDEPSIDWFEPLRAEVTEDGTDMITAFAGEADE
ncbi:hypothetical protein O4158_10100 [Gordonia amicalis]|uniref:hypothetical protein n=1 Tax=Gordonia amicalis TaxID=89053 RepID=UPI0022B3BA61|nr:hypothetical protein [Gordonia amicalis]MCZ4579428.1 hypothetical protein [Gordonia amicalis]